MTHGLVLAKDNTSKNPLWGVQSGRVNTKKGGLKDEQVFQHLLDVLSSSKTGNAKAKTSPDHVTLQGDSLAAVFQVAHDKEAKSAAGPAASTVQHTQVAGESQIQTGSGGTGTQSINPQKNRPEFSIQLETVKSHAVTQKDTAPAHGGKHTPHVKHRIRRHTGGPSVESKGQALLGFFLIPVAGSSQLPLAVHNKTVQTHGSATGVQRTGSKSSLRAAQSRITATSETAARTNPGLRRQTTPGIGTSQQQKLVHQGQAGPDGVSVKAVQHENETGLTIAGLPVQKVVLVQTQASGRSGGNARTNKNAASPLQVQGRAQSVGGQFTNTEQVPKTTQMSALVHGGKIAAPVPAGKQHAKGPISVPTAVGNGSGQQVPTLAGPSFTSSSQAVHIQDTQVYHQFASMIAQQVQTGSQTLHVQVHPQGLGSVTVTVGQQNQGLSIQLSATNPATAAWLQQESAQLTQALQSAGVHLANLQVGVSQQQTQSQTEGRSGQRKGSKTPEPERIRGVAQEAVQAKPVVSVLDARQSTISFRA